MLDNLFDIEKNEFLRGSGDETKDSKKTEFHNFSDNKTIMKAPNNSIDSDTAKKMQSASNNRALMNMLGRIQERRQNISNKSKETNTNSNPESTHNKRINSSSLQWDSLDNSNNNPAWKDSNIKNQNSQIHTFHKSNHKNQENLDKKSLPRGISIPPGPKMPPNNNNNTKFGNNGNNINSKLGIKSIGIKRNSVSNEILFNTRSKFQNNTQNTIRGQNDNFKEKNTDNSNSLAQDFLNNRFTLNEKKNTISSNYNRQSNNNLQDKYNKGFKNSKNYGYNGNSHNYRQNNPQNIQHNKYQNDHPDYQQNYHQQQKHNEQLQGLKTNGTKFTSNQANYERNNYSGYGNKGTMNFHSGQSNFDISQNKNDLMHGERNNGFRENFSQTDSFDKLDAELNLNNYKQLLKAKEWSHNSKHNLNSETKHPFDLRQSVPELDVESHFKNKTQINSFNNKDLRLEIKSRNKIESVPKIPESNPQLRDSQIMDDLQQLQFIEKLKMEIIDMLYDKNYTEMQMVRHIKKQRYIGSVTFGMMMYNLMELFGEDMIIKKSLDAGGTEYSLSTRFKAIMDKFRLNINNQNNMNN